MNQLTSFHISQLPPEPGKTTTNQKINIHLARQSTYYGSGSVCQVSNIKLDIVPFYFCFLRSQKCNSSIDNLCSWISCRLIAQLTIVVGGAVARALIQAYKDAAQRKEFMVVPILCFKGKRYLPPGLSFSYAINSCSLLLINDRQFAERSCPANLQTPHVSRRGIQDPRN